VARSDHPAGRRYPAATPGLRLRPQRRNGTTRARALSCRAGRRDLARSARLGGPSDATSTTSPDAGTLSSQCQEGVSIQQERPGRAALPPPGGAQAVASTPSRGHAAARARLRHPRHCRARSPGYRWGATCRPAAAAWPDRSGTAYLHVPDVQIASYSAVFRATRSDRCCSELSRWACSNGGNWRCSRTWGWTADQSYVSVTVVRDGSVAPRS
jgi:hypothetical protein